MKFFDADRVSELEKQMAQLSERWRHQDEEYNKMLFLVQSFQEQVTQMNDRSEMLALVKNIVSQHLTKAKSDGTAHSEVDLCGIILCADFNENIITYEIVCPLEEDVFEGKIRIGMRLRNSFIFAL